MDRIMAVVTTTGSKHAMSRTPFRVPNGRPSVRMVGIAGRPECVWSGVRTREASDACYRKGDDGRAAANQTVRRHVHVEIIAALRVAVAGVTVCRPPPCMWLRAAAWLGRRCACTWHGHAQFAQ